MTKSYELQHDEQGRAFYFTPEMTEPNYVSPVSMGADAPVDDSGSWHMAPRWNTQTAKWDKPFDWGKALTVATAGGLGAGALSAAGAFGGAASGAPAVTPATSGSGFVASDIAATEGAMNAAASGGGLLSTIGSMATKFAPKLGQVGGAISAATNAAGNNRLDADSAAVRGTAAYEAELGNRAAVDAKQRSTAADDIYRASWYKNRTASPNNTRGLTPTSPEFMNSLSALEQQGMQRIAQPSPYNMNTVDPLRPYKPTKPGMLEKAGTWAGPLLSGYSHLFGK